MTFVGKVGHDDYAAGLEALLTQEGVCRDGIIYTEALPTAVGFIVSSSDGANMIVVDPAARGDFTLADVDSRREMIESAAVLVCPFEVPLETALHAATIAHTAGVPAILNPAPACDLRGTNLSAAFALTYYYSGGTPIGLGGAFGFPILGNRPYVTTYDGWRGSTSGKRFDPFVDNFFQPKSFFPAQPNNQLGNATRRNPQLRTWPSYSENFSLARSISVTERIRVDVRGEAFNIFNRVRMGDPDTNLASVNFGLVRSQGNEPRKMQLGLKLYW